MSTFTSIYLYLNDVYEPSVHSDVDVRWMVHFGIDCVTMDIYYLHDDMSDEEFMTCVTLCEPVSCVSQVVEAVRDYAEGGYLVA